MRTWFKIQSFVANCLYWFFNFPQYGKAMELKDYWTNELREFADVARFMRQFEYTSDKWIDWYAYPLTYFARDMHGDCDDATLIGKWALKRIGIESRILRLETKEQVSMKLWLLRLVSRKNRRKDHTICVSNDNDILISNDTAIRFRAIDWYAFILRWFDYKYNVIKDA